MQRSHKNKIMNILITGVTGFVGQHLFQFLSKKYSVIGTTRQKNTQFIMVDETTNWTNILLKIDIVIHLANRAHIMNDKHPEAFYQVNVLNFEKFLNACKKAKIKQFIYLSSIKVNGELTTTKPFLYNDKANPSDDYAVSKYQAEQTLKKSSFDWTIIRPPLIYGDGVKGNFASMLNLIKKSMPLPLKNINNKRSLLHIDNLCEMIEKCLNNQKANEQVFLVSDGFDVSTSELIQRIAKQQDKKIFLFKLPFFSTLMKLLGKQQQFNRLNQSLQLDIEHTKQQLNWSPKYEL